MHRSFRLNIISYLRDSLDIFRLPREKVQSLCIQLDVPKNESFGDFSSNLALKLSSELNKSAPILAESIVAQLKKNTKLMSPRGAVKDIRVAPPGFINFYLSDEYFYKLLRESVLLSESFGSSNLGRGRRVLIEFVSANPTGPLSVAHARQAAVGDSLALLLKTLGFKVKKEYYLNDEGNQIDILGRSVMLRFKQLKGQDVSFPQECYQGDYIRDIAKEIVESGKDLKTDKDFSDYAVKYLLKIIKDELNDFGTVFDSWYSQAALSRSGRIEKVIANLRKKGYIYEKEGAVWFKSTLFGDDKDRVLIKSDGSYTYLTPDIAYHQDKFRRGFNWLINLWGPDHHGYIRRLKAAVLALGKKEEMLSLIIVQLASIFREGTPVLMSTRKGEYITLREVLDEVGKDASRFFFLMRRTSSHLDFDLALARKHTAENPVFYVQYAHARISSILKNTKIKVNPRKARLELLRYQKELRLMKVIAQFPYVLEVCFRNLDPFFLTEYLKNLAEVFHKFYDTHRVLTDDRSLSEARLVLISGAKVALSNGLRILGISAPEKM